jgi:alcohol dehydrogenase class IV
MRFEFATAAGIVFGPGTLKEAGPMARQFGRHALVVTGRTPARADPLVTGLAQHGVRDALFSIPGEPSTEMVEHGVAAARQAGAELVIGFGGGSAIDAGKAIAAMLTNPGELLDYLEVVGRGRSLTVAPAPFIAIPTTAGTGAEVTRNAVLAAPAQQVKVSLRSPLLLPQVAIVDPELTRELPRHITAASGLDALTQLIEPFVSCRANPMTDALCREGLRRAAWALPRVCTQGDDLAARTEMALASLWSGMALANAGLGAVHGFAGPIGGRFSAPHGAICAALLPSVMAANLRALRERAPTGETLARFDEVARLLTGKAEARADDGVRWVSALVKDLPIPRLSDYGIAATHVPELVQKATAASSMKGNPLPLTAAEMSDLLLAAL